MSDKPVAERLQVKGGRKLAIAGAPAAVDKSIGAPRTEFADADVVLTFARNHAELAARLAKLLTAKPDAILWLAYPKLTSKLAGDISRDVIHDTAPAHDLDAVSQIAIDDDWSAMRFKRIG